MSRHEVRGFTRADYFWSHVDKTDGCWIWTAYRNERGYGQMGIDGRRNMLAHRFSYELHFGPLGDEWALHRCDNPPCVRPDHLYAGDVRDNVRDMLERGRHVAVTGERSPQAKLTDAQVREIRNRHVPGLNRWVRGNTAELAAEFGVSATHIRSLVKGEWRRTA